MISILSPFVLTYSLPKSPANQRAWSSIPEGIRGSHKRPRVASLCGRRHNQLLEQTWRRMRYQRVPEIVRARKLASYEKEFARFFTCRDELAEEIRRNSSTAPANAPGCPCNCFTQDI